MDSVTADGAPALAGDRAWRKCSTAVIKLVLVARPWRGRLRPCADRELPALPATMVIVVSPPDLASSSLL
ncbi:hypothetical protein XaFJ1_GM002200 [Xanthomonas albilineans]|nr:hypothetical protein XalbCFBP2523_08095 [Xanthomonas albilineans]QHQ28925.1 hypothetical protein XaFJ1_GM002200 [Xanthomonas albilineans]